MVDTHRRGSGVDGSSGPGAASVSAAVAAVVATAPAHADMHRVLSAPMLSPPASHGDRGSGMDPNQNRLPPLRQVSVCLVVLWQREGACCYSLIVPFGARQPST